MFTNVVVGVEGRQGGRDAIALAQQLSAPDGQITLAHIHGGNAFLRPGAALAFAGGRQRSEKLLAVEADASAADVHLTSFAASSVGRGLHDVAERTRADLIVVGSCHRATLGRAFLGENTSRALNGARCAVAIAPGGYATRADGLSTIGVGYDGSPEGERALAAARELAARLGSTIKALAVISLQNIPYGEPIHDNWPEAAKQLVDAERGRLNGFGDIVGDATYGEPSDELATFSEKLDLLIVGSRSYGPVGRLMNGSTSNYLAQRARCALLVLPRSATTGIDADTAEREKPIGVGS
jgi:nucleotide-binding universal stress UspA family protein